MFTGIVAERGVVTEIVHDADADSAVLTVEVPTLAADLEHGASIAVNGVCLTATNDDGANQGARVRLDVIGETLRRTTTGELSEGSRVNLERCVPAGGRLDGHLVQGHVDGVARVVEREDLGGWERFRLEIPAELAPYVAEKGSIAVDGVSLTITAVSEPGEQRPWFEVGLIPTTLEVTTLGERGVGSRVNIEVDVMAKYAQRLLSFATAGESTTEETQK